MSRIFVSHSSANNEEAIALRDWLVSQGFDDLFLDLDPERGLKAGERWQAALKRAAERCELVIFLVSPEWAASKWCLAEFLLAKNLSKRIFGVIVEPTPLADLPVEMTAEWQLVDLTAGKRDHTATVASPHGDKTGSVAFAKTGLDRLRIGLLQAGIDARYFAWPPEDDPDRAPYRGLQALEAEDAGIFFGRDGPTVVGLDLLRGLREGAPPRLLVILGASGAGKSSFLRAGLLPRLARDSRHFLPLPVIRPERAALTGEAGLVASLEQGLKQTGIGRSRADIRKAVATGAEAVTALLAELVAAMASPHSTSDWTEGSKPPTVILSVDQAEELFLAEGAEEARAFLDLLRHLVTRDDPQTIALFTIRSDSYERLQTAPALEGLRPQLLSLPPMPKGAYAEVIKGPARRLESAKHVLKIEEPLVDALLADIEAGGAKDALPLLAFTLERLYVEQGGDGDLKLSEYEALGGVKGSIEAAVARALSAADHDPKIARDREARLHLLRRGLIPWLAGIDPETGSPRRRVARCSEIPAESGPLIDLLVEQRLLSTDLSKETGEVTIEPVHEALLRQWGLLQGWLAEDAGLLGVLEGVKRAARDWVVNAKGAGWLAHAGGRLGTAEKLLERPDLAASLDATDRDYLAACRQAEQAGTKRRRRLQTAVGALVLLLLVVGIGWFAGPYLKEQAHWHFAMGPTVLSVAQEQALQPKDEFAECKAGCPLMQVLPAGAVNLASSQSGAFEVALPKPFAVGKYEVTFAEWDACVAAGGCPYVEDGGLGRDTRPVINVSWHEAQGYTAWLSRLTGKPYRLLSEAEWQYAARSGTTTAYFFGDDATALGDYAWYDANSDLKTHPVGQKKPNAYGLHDMAGNVWEWVQDCQHASYGDGPTDGSAWLVGNCDRRVHCGGSWSNGPEYLHSDSRIRAAAGLYGTSLGFRVARTLEP